MKSISCWERHACPETAAAWATFVLLGLGLLQLATADMLAAPPALGMALVCLLSGVALASSLYRYRSFARETAQGERTTPVSEAIARRDAGSPEPPIQSEAGTCQVKEMLAAASRKRDKFRHRLWTRSDGFTMSGPA